MAGMQILKFGALMSAGVSLTIVIPCFNEEGAIPEILRQTSKLSEDGWCSFIIVDNGSTDNSQVLLRGFAHPKITVIRVDENLGYGGGIFYGLGFASTPYVGWMHADLQTPILELNKFKDHFEQYDFMKGIRIGRKGSDKIFSRSMSIFESLLFLRYMPEINAQPTIFRKDLLNSWDRFPSDFSLDLFVFVSAKRSKFRIGRILVPFYPRKFGDSSWNHGFKSRMKFIIRTLRYSIKLRVSLK